MQSYHCKLKLFGVWSLGGPELKLRAKSPVVSRLGVAVLPGAESSGLKGQSPFQGLDFQPAGLGSFSPNVYVRA